MAEKRNLSRYCIYTIRDTNKLDEACRYKGGSDTLEENKGWVLGKRLFDEAKRNGEQMPVLFAAAEKEGGLLYYAILTAVEVDDSSTTKYSFTGLTPLNREWPKSTLTKKSDSKPLSDDYIRPYSVCFTPDL